MKGPRSSARVLRVGDTRILWTVHTSSKALRKRIVATPDGVEVVVPESEVGDENAVEKFVHAKRRWIYDKVRAMEGHKAGGLDQLYVSGARLLYRGRWLGLTVQVDDVADVLVTCRSHFHIRVPGRLPDKDRHEAVREAVTAWMQDHASRDARLWSGQYSRALEVTPRDVRLADQKTMWGSCGQDGVLRINWRLVQAPAAAMEYVVAHEVAHLVERNHTDLFWATLAEVMPDWAERKGLLERWEREQMMVGREV